MTQVPFNVSARAAILIGRENIANSKGAIIELVKNCHDADSKFCIVYVDNELTAVNKNISLQQKQKLINAGINPLYFDVIYTEISDHFYLKSDAKKRYFNAFEKRVKKLAQLYIIDVGDGMSQETILKHWMTIGTDNKLFDYRTSSGRIKSGAKGIGRFALDKLGSQCTMTTISRTKPETSQRNKSFGSVWTVDWRDFEGLSKTINNVTANLEELTNSDLVSSTFDKANDFDIDNLWARLESGEYNKSLELPSTEEFDNFTHGTVLKISNLHDIWDAAQVTGIYKDLEILVPPRDIQDFRIFVLSSLEPKAYGEVLGPDCEDFDYKIEAKANEQQMVEITVYREEYDFDKIPDEFLQRESIKNKSNFPQKKFVINYSFSDLLSGFNDVNGVLETIGSFDFNFYFLKRTSTTKDTQRFFYKNFSDAKRKAWLNQFAGIKMYRDSFRVRPYGEVDDPAFDWLGLGLRQSSSPAGVAKIDGGYRVRPENIAGAIYISRLSNLEFIDKSSREGFQETKAFSVFKSLIISIIDKFERDRSFIANEFAQYDKDPNREIGKIDDDTERLAKEIIERERKKRTAQKTSTLKIPPNELSILARFAEEKADEFEKLLEEQKLLRAMASSGIVAASFGHDLGKTKNSLDSRFDELIELFAPKVKAQDFDDVHEFDNPYEFIKTMRKEDRNIAMWIGFSLGFTRKDKRKRKQLYLSEFFEQIQSDWKETLSDRGITLSVDCPDDLKMRVFEIDFDSIFLNLIVNSIDAFTSTRPRTSPVRKINIIIDMDEDLININYQDSGPGLPKSLPTPEVIFEPMFTTRRSTSGEEIGTGLGMWIVKTISDEYQAKVQLTSNASQTGFGIIFSFPIKYKSKA
jgi:signal transduction histidine kinase